MTDGRITPDTLPGIQWMDSVYFVQETSRGSTSPTDASWPQDILCNLRNPLLLTRSPPLQELQRLSASSSYCRSFSKQRGFHGHSLDSLNCKELLAGMQSVLQLFWEQVTLGTQHHTWTYWDALISLRISVSSSFFLVFLPLLPSQPSARCPFPSSRGTALI